MEKASFLKTLMTGLLFLDFKQCTEELEYEAMGRMTKKHGVIQRRYQYAQDLSRALNEAKLTSVILSTIDSQLDANGVIYEPEEIIAYYNGIFLDYVHQIKDKALRLVWWMMQDENLNSIPQEPERIVLAKFDRYRAELEKAGVYQLICEWNQQSSSGISVALKKRTQHHHFVSNLQFNSDFQNIKMSKLMLAPNSSPLLTDYGRTRMKQIGEEAFSRWKADNVDKNENTLRLINDNIESLAEKLINHFHIMTDLGKQAEVVNKYLESQKCFDIKNEANTTKIIDEHRRILDELVKSSKNFFADKLLSIYLVGSVSRGEYLPGSSDVNLIYIFDSGDLDGSFFDKQSIDVHYFSEEEFLSEKNKKWRFICWSDGIPIFGKQYAFDKEDFPKPGTLLSLLLNRGFIERLEELKLQASRLTNPKSELIREYTLKAAKIMLDFAFGVAISNKPFYSSSRMRKIQYIEEMFPSMRRQTNVIEAMYSGKGIVSHRDYPLVIDAFLEGARKNYQKMITVEEEIIKDEKKKNN